MEKSRSVRRLPDWVDGRSLVLGRTDFMAAPWVAPLTARQSFHHQAMRDFRQERANEVKTPAENAEGR